MPKPGEKTDQTLPTTDPPGAPIGAPITGETGYPDLTPLLECARSMGECVCQMVAPLESIPAIATAIAGLAANVQQQTAVLVKVAEGLGVPANVPVGTGAAWDFKSVADAINAIDMPCTDDQVRVDKLRTAFRLASAATPATAQERAVARDLARQLRQKVGKYPVLADLATRPLPSGGC